MQGSGAHIWTWSQPRENQRTTSIMVILFSYIDNCAFKICIIKHIVLKKYFLKLTWDIVILQNEDGVKTDII